MNDKNNKIYIKKLTIKNFRCIKNIKIECTTPDGEHRDSGLNVIIGENNSGKSTVLEAISFFKEYPVGYPLYFDDIDICNDKIPKFTVSLTNNSELSRTHHNIVGTWSLSNNRDSLKLDFLPADRLFGVFNEFKEGAVPKEFHEDYTTYRDPNGARSNIYGYFRV